MGTTLEQDVSKDLLRQYAGKILGTRRLFEIHKIDPSLSEGAAQAREAIIVSNYVYLTEAGVINPDQYLELFKRCSDSGDFYELALLTRKHSIDAAKKYLADHPGLHQSGDATNPGKGNIESSLHILEGRMEGLSEVHKKREKVPVSNIGGPAIHEIPDWLLELTDRIREPGMRIKNVYEMIEGRQVARDVQVDGRADKTEKDAMRVLGK